LHRDDVLPMLLCAGDVLPTTALDNLASDPSAVLVDIRSAMSKATTGIPDLPDNGEPGWAVRASWQVELAG
jgi:hypothetical protein